ncbi:MAG: hypothetical protein ABS40_04120 [Agrobacterium sp. SCN 61-19]|nr:MAG: hypothetical protein ABS40_04120 [Agrobacterium sp. SCN 61-19]
MIVKIFKGSVAIENRCILMVVDFERKPIFSCKLHNVANFWIIQNTLQMLIAFTNSSLILCQRARYKSFVFALLLFMPLRAVMKTYLVVGKYLLRLTVITVGDHFAGKSEE